MKDSKYLDGYYLYKEHWGLNDRSRVLLEVMEGQVDKDDSILELGCSAGRNLKALHVAGYKNLTGLEMSKKAYKQIGRYTKKIFGRYEDLIDELEPYDVVISMSFLQELGRTPAADECVAKLPRIVKKYLITIDSEIMDFQQILLTNGLKKIEEIGVHKHSPFSTPIKVYAKE